MGAPRRVSAYATGEEFETIEKEVDEEEPEKSRGRTIVLSLSRENLIKTFQVRCKKF